MLVAVTAAAFVVEVLAVGGVVSADAAVSASEVPDFQHHSVFQKFPPAKTTTVGTHELQPEKLPDGTRQAQLRTTVCKSKTVQTRPVPRNTKKRS